MTDFTTQRRQPFVTAEYYEAMKSFLKQTTSFWRESSTNVSKDPVRNRHTALKQFASLTFDLWILRYSAGVPISRLRDELESVVSALEERARFSANIINAPHITPFEFTDIDDYERALQQISLCILLHREDLLKRMAALIDPAYLGEDTIIEDLMAFYSDERFDVDEWFHEKPYTTLINAMYSDDRQKAATTLKRYCKEWCSGIVDLAT